jgi:hypothetical protein
MKTKYNLLVVAGILLATTLAQISCSSEKKSAVACPDFSHSRNMKSRHAELKNSYPDQQVRIHPNSTWARQDWFRGSSKVSEGANPGPGRSFVPEYAQIPVTRESERIYPAAMHPAGTQLAGLVIPGLTIQKQVYSAVTELPAISAGTGTNSAGCDTIVLRNGDIIEAKVLEIGQQEIRYRKCGDNEGPVFVAAINEVFMVKHPNGTRDYFTSERNTAPSRSGAIPAKTDGMAVAGFIGSLVGLFILGIPLGIMAVVFGFVSIGKIKRHPERYKGRGFAIASIIIGAIDVIGMLIILGSL